MQTILPQSGTPARRLLVLTMAAGVLAALLGAFAPWRSDTEAAGGVAPCIIRPQTQEEIDWLPAAQVYRDAKYGPNSPAMEFSAPLNASAIGYAEYVLQNPGAVGHFADGTNWAQRAVRCGWPTIITSTEAPLILWGTDPSAADAVDWMGQEPPQQNAAGQWIEVGINASPSFNLKCVGIGHASTGSKTAWIAVFFAPIGGKCPQTVSSGPSPTSTGTPTKTPTTTPTPSSGTLIYKSFGGGLSRDSDTPDGGATTSTSTPTPATPTVTSTPSGTVQPPFCRVQTAPVLVVDKVAEVAMVTALGDLSGWYIVSEAGAQKFTFPQGFIATGTPVSVHSNVLAFAATATALWWTSSEVWLDTQDDDAALYDCFGTKRAEWFDGS